MNTTSLSLLDRLKNAKQDATAWQSLQEIYLPLIRSWLSCLGSLRGEVDDLAQEVLVVVLRELPAFERRRDGAFRAWLRQITVNRVRSFCKARQRQPRAGLGHEEEQLLAQLADPASDLARQWDREHDRHVLQKLLAMVRPDFEPTTWQAFIRFALEGLPATRVAQELGISESAVVQAKLRILKRLREETEELLE
ncbi:MAG: sigma-70 family RNA polymerase sigma factor [Planctomycetota bacterium]|nr:MAG: sigma-70 family RNA polymerase sigma factor [Planctomycetota bacterium]